MAETLAEWGTLPVIEGMRYALEGGKGLRGYLAIESSRLHGIPADRARFAAAAIDAIHAYSLVHDDLPAMDDDDMRRGRPTVHKKWDEATGILVGDGLLTLAFELLAENDCGGLVGSLAQAAGAQGMVLGQAQDMAAEAADVPLTLSEITALQKNKTGALIEWAAMAGPRLAGDDPSALGRYADCLGLAFQIADDLLDVEGDAEVVGKAVGKDEDAGKATFVTILGVTGAKARAAKLVEEACTALDPYGAEAASLKDAARFVIARRS
ncbi:MAG: polyprenyl synthetase family protein [Pseudomonadota bacterium]